MIKINFQYSPASRLCYPQVLRIPPKTEIWGLNISNWVGNYHMMSINKNDPLCMKNILAYGDYAIILHPG